MASDNAYAVTIPEATGTLATVEAYDPMDDAMEKLDAGQHSA